MSFSSTQFESSRAGLGAHMARVYRNVSVGVLLSAVTASIAASPAMRHILFTDGTHGAHSLGLTGLGWFAQFLPLIMLITALFTGMERWSASGMRIFFYLFTAAEGLGLSSVLLVYSGAHVVRATLVTAIAFVALSIYGCTTKRDLTRLGTFCMMGLWGLIGLGVVRAMFGLPMNEMLISLVSLFVFAGLTTYDTQKAKSDYMDNPRDSPRLAVWAAMELYLDIINMFLDMLNLTGDQDGVSSAITDGATSDGGFLDGVGSALGSIV